MPLPTEPEAKLPQPPEGTTWISRGWGWTNDGKPAVHCTRSHRSPRVIQSKVALVPAGGVGFFYWEAVPVGTFRGVLKTDSVDTGKGVNPDYVDAPKEEIHFSQKPGEAPVVTVFSPDSIDPSDLPNLSDVKRSITVVHAIPEPEAPAVPVSDPAFDAAWAAWRGSKAGQENISVRGLDVSRLWTIMEARIRATFEAGWNSK